MLRLNVEEDEFGNCIIHDLDDNTTTKIELITERDELLENARTKIVKKFTSLIGWIKVWIKIRLMCVG